MESFGWSFIGSGNIAKKVLREITKTERHTLISLYSRNFEEAEKLTGKYGGTACKSLKEAVTHADVQGVYIATPHSVHYENILECLSLGKSVFCEKPLVINLNQFQDVQKSASEKGVFLGEAMWTRYSPIIIDVVKLVKSGRMGKIQKITADLGYDATMLMKRKRLFLPEYAGGALLDVGVYLLSFVEMFLGYPEKIDACAQFGEQNIDLEDKMVFYYGDTLCELECSLQKVTPTQATILCENGSVSIPMFFKPIEAHITIGDEAQSLSAQRGYIFEFDQASRDIRAGERMSAQNPHTAIGNVIRMADNVRAQIGLTYPACIEKTNRKNK